MLMGFPAAGKSSVAREFEDKGFVVLNRDKAGGKVIDLLPKLMSLLKSGSNVLLDNTFPSADSRKPFIDAAKQAGQPIECVWLATTIEQAQFNACTRMVRQYGKLLTPDEIKKANDPNTYPPAVLFKYRKDFERPLTDEGFVKVEKRNFVRTSDPAYSNEAIVFDFDGTLRDTKSSNIYPTDTDDIVLLDGRKEKIQQLKKQDILLLGASNQSGIAKGALTSEQAEECFDHTIKKLGAKIDYAYCPHRVPPITCWCRKPMPGLGVQFIEKYKLCPANVTVVGDMTSDKTFAERCGFKYVDAKSFFA